MRTSGYIRKIAFPLAALGLLFVAPCGPGPAPPDVVIVVVDSLRPGLIGSMGGPGQAPRLKGLAHESVVFDDVSYSGFETSTAIRSLLTGQHPHLLDQERPGQEATLVETLSSRGYATGSYQPGAEGGRVSEIEAGFDFVSAGGHWNDMGAPTGELLHRMRGRPFLLFVQSADLHDQSRIDLQPEGESGRELIDEYDHMVSSRRALAALRDVDAQADVLERLQALQPRVHELYGEALRTADDRIGKVIDQLRARGSWERTLFIVVSDPGRVSTEGGGRAKTAPIFQEQLHADLLVRFPKGQFGGRRISIPVSVLDVLPTVLEVVGAPIGDLDISGSSLVPAVESADLLDPQPRLMAIHSSVDRAASPGVRPAGETKLVVREGEYKAILDLRTNTTSLFDLMADPGETRDLAGELPQLAFRLSKLGAEDYVDVVSHN